MPCFHPLKAYRSLEGGIQFHSPYSDVDHSFPIPCRQCTGCRTEYARQWAMRLTLEREMWDKSTFITLTYDNEHLPEHNTLVKSDFQKFMKRLRKKRLTGKPEKNPIISDRQESIRFFHAGEYGEKFGRPHYHAILFNCDFADRKSLQGHRTLTTSETLNELWGMGKNNSIGDVTFQSTAYVAGYIQKKINGNMEKNINPETGLRHYEIITADGEIITRQKEYATMSRNPGIAGNWLSKFHKDVYPSDRIHINGMELKPPKYFDRVFENDLIQFPQGEAIITDLKEQRIEDAKQYAHLRTPEALAYLEKVHKAKHALFKRKKL